MVPVVAAGNDYDAGGLGTIDSPGNAPAAITVAASTMGNGDGTRPDHVADFSSAGPTPVSLQLKPDVTAPGVDVLSSIPAHDFEVLDGTSMATPHVAGAAALLLQRHPTWVQAIVADDGCGFDVDRAMKAEASWNHLGLHGMWERAALLNGSVTIESTPGEGTTVYARLPAGEVRDGTDPGPDRG